MKKYVIAFVVIASAFAFMPSRANAQWSQTGSFPGGNYPVHCITSTSADLFAGTYGSGVFLSTNSGDSWVARNSGLPTGININAFQILSTFLFAGTDSGVYATSNRGETWTQVNTGLPAKTAVNAFVIVGTNLFAGTSNGVYTVSLITLSWSPNGTGLPSGIAVTTMAISNASILAGTNGDGVYQSADSGKTWFAFNKGLPGTPHIVSITSNGANLLVATKDLGVYGGNVYQNNWTAASTGFGNIGIQVLIGYDTFALAGGMESTNGSQPSIYLTTTSGANWVADDEGITEGPDSYVYSFGTDAQNFYAGTNGLGIWRHPISNITDGVNEPTSGNPPANIVLSQNYPNPFSTSTAISYFLPEPAAVSLKIYNSLGEEIASLINGELQTGRQSVTFLSDNLPNGIYYYRFIAGKDVQSGIMSIVH